MRSTDEQLQDIMKRAELLTEQRRIKKQFIISAISVCACIAILAVAVISFSRLEPVAQESGDMQLYGSLLLVTPQMKYAIIAILSLALGICSTLLCLRIRDLKRKERK